MTHTYLKSPFQGAYGRAYSIIPEKCPIAPGTPPTAPRNAPLQNTGPGISPKQIQYPPRGEPNPARQRPQVNYLPRGKPFLGTRFFDTLVRSNLLSCPPLSWGQTFKVYIGLVIAPIAPHTFGLGSRGNPAKSEPYCP